MKYKEKQIREERLKKILRSQLANLSMKTCNTFDLMEGKGPCCRVEDLVDIFDDKED